MNSWFIFLFGWTLQIHCFNFYIVCTYCSEFIVATLFKNCIVKIPSLSQKVLAMTSPAEVCTLNVFSSTFVHSWFSILWLPSFEPPKGWLLECCFVDNSELKHSMHEKFGCFRKEFYMTSMHHLTQRWKKWVDTEGNLWKNNKPSNDVSMIYLNFIIIVLIV